MFGGSSSSGSAALQLVQAWQGRQLSAPLRVDFLPDFAGLSGTVAMAFFRTKERLSDRKVDRDARAQRRQQQQMQQQILERERAAAAMPAPAEAV